MRLSTGAFEETFPEADHRRCRSRLPNATGTGALPERAAHRAPQMPPVIRPGNGSSGRGVADLLRSLLLFAARGAFVTALTREIYHPQSCHSRCSAGKYQAGERNDAHDNETNRG